MTILRVPQVVPAITKDRDIPLRRFHISYVINGIKKTVCFCGENQEQAIQDAIELVPEITKNGTNISEVIEK